MWSNVHFLEVLVVIRRYEWGGVEEEGSPDNVHVYPPFGELGNQWGRK